MWASYTLTCKEKIVVAITAALLFFKAAWLVYFIDCGIDMTDEAHALHLIKHYRAYPQVFHEFHFLLGKLFWFIPVTAVNMRWLNYALETISAAWLCTAVMVYAAKYGWWRAPAEEIVFASLTACTLFASTIYQSVSYYQLTNFNLYIASGCLLFAIKYQERTKHVILITALAGIVSAMQFFVKFTSSVLLIIMVAGVCLKLLGRHQLKAGAAFVLAFALTFSSMIVSRGGWQSWLGDYSEGYRLLKLITYNNLDIVWQVYIKTDFWLNIRLLWLPALAFALAGNSRFSTAGSYPTRIFIVWILSLGWVILLPQFIFLHNPPYNLGLMEYRIINWIVLTLLALWLIAYQASSCFPPALNRMLVFMILLPLICYVGSDTPFSDMVYESVLPWGILGALFGARIIHASATKLNVLMVTFWIVLWGVQFVGFRYQPYYLQQNIFAQKYTVPGLEQIKTDSINRNFIADVYKNLKTHGYKPKDEIVALHNMPGVVYLLDAFTQGTIFFYPKMDGGMEDGYISYTCSQLSKMKFDGHSKKPYLLLSSDVVVAETECIKKLHVGFPENYRAADTLYNPSIQKQVVLWVPRN